MTHNLCVDCQQRPGVVEVGDDEEGTAWFCRTCYAENRLSGLIVPNPDVDPDPVPADAGRVLHFAPDGSPLRGYYPGVECEHGHDACPLCDGPLSPGKSAGPSTPQRT